MPSPIIALLYAACLIAIAFLAVMVYRRSPRSRLHRSFSWLSVSLLAWLATLYLFHHVEDTTWLLILGRLNFASVLFLSFYGFLFVRNLIRRPIETHRLFYFETLAAAILTLFTPLIDRSEVLATTAPVTHFGILFPLYVVHVVGYLGAALLEAFRSRATASPRLRAQLSLLAYGGAVSATVAVTTNLALPYVYGNFAFQETGALSIVAFVVSTGYAVLTYRLFDIRILIRRTLILAALVALIQHGYSSFLSLLTRYLPAPVSSIGRFIIGVLTVLIVSLTFHYARPWLERALNRFLFRRK